MNRGVLSAIAALLLVSLVAGCGASGSNANPSPSAPPPLTPGQHTTAVFKPAVTYTVPAGWTNPTDDVSYFNLMPTLDQSNGIDLFHNWHALSQAADCPFTPEPGVGSGALDLLMWIRGRKGLTVSPPAMVSVAGLPATMIDLSIAPDWKQSCSFANGIPTVPLLVDETTQLHWVVAGSETLRLYLLDLPGGGTLIVDLDSFDGTGFQNLLTIGSPIVKSLALAGQ